MKLKNKINLIQEHFRDNTPELDLKYILDHANVTRAPLTSPSKPMFRIHKLAAAIGFSFIIFLGIVYFLSSNLTPLSKKKFDMAPEDSESTPIEYQHYGFIGVSMVTIIDNNQDTNPAEINFLSKYTKTIEVLRNVQLNNSFLKRKSDNPNYNYLVYFDTKDFLNKALNYKVYYNSNEMFVQINDDKYLFKINENVQNNNIIEVQYKNEELQIVGTIDYKNTNIFTYVISKNNQTINKAQLFFNSEKIIRLEDITSDLVKNVYTIKSYSNSLIVLNMQTLNRTELNNYFEIDPDSFKTINITVTSDLSNSNYIYTVKQGDSVLEYSSKRD